MRIHCNWNVRDCPKEAFPENSWRPETTFVNALDDVLLVDQSPIESKGGGEMTTSARYRGTFAARCRYATFPMDRQTLSIVLRVPRVNRQRISAVEVDAQRCTTSTSLDTADAAPPDFHVVDLQCQVRYNDPGKTNFKPDFVVNVTLIRRSTYYLTTMYAPLACIVGMALNCFLVPLDQFADRTNIVITLILCVVAFKFAVASRLPAISTSTHLDKYFVFLYVFLVAVAIANVVSLIHFRDDPRFDVSCGIAMLCIFVLGNAWVLFWLFWHARETRLVASTVQLRGSNS